MNQIDFLPAGVPIPPGATPSWFTDRGWFEMLEDKLLRERMIPRPFDLDPCGHHLAPVSQLIQARGGTVWTASMNGLAHSWAGRVAFVNPPYEATELELWCPKMELEWPGAAGLVSLLPAWTDRGWWHDTIEPARISGSATVRFVRGRLSFGWPDNPQGISGDGAKFASVVVNFRAGGQS